MTDTRWKWLLGAIVAIQIAVFSLFITDPFVDGRLHINWGPAFWLLKAQHMHEVNFFEAYLGVVADTKIVDGRTVAAGWYSSHPQFIAIPLYVWTAIFGFGEWVVRSLAALVTVATTIIFWFAMRVRHTPKQATLFAAAWAFMPLYVAFGRKLDQEPFVMLFFALACLGYERFASGKTRMPWLWGASMLFMVWSDWSGFVIAGLLLLAHAALMRYWKPARLLALWNLIGSGCGAAIVAFQAILPNGSLAGAMTEAQNLYAYRAGTSEKFFWYTWAKKQLSYFWQNYVWLFGFLSATIFIRSVLMKKNLFTAIKTRGFEIEHLFGIAAIACLVYALLVPQATSIHIYYQYFYGPLVAWGGLLFFEWMERYVHRYAINAFVPATIFGIVLALGLYHGITILSVDRMAGWGWTGEIGLMKYVATLDKNKPIIAITGGANINTWFDNPNITYYAGRHIQTIDSPAGDFTYPYVIMGNEYITERTNELNKKVASDEEYRILQCSQALCLLGVVKK
ncbi:MAG: hypothetical protein A3C15_03990 [Candidatus Magasanikbacteria bacterium RIFCSPHIGHO2_02_FULL_50_9b]|uniref:Glycosyltransferase RgtA/B/C/D-like domain-containing protein n=1 Tax=Candidatus Magasanikbacteria bacterium RIFCSPHIGHO2_02_FULL_50_9b TaxID=1798682 RepID=A0A1F6M9H8_9BACT|nr:MAG: hypothetical protein A3C15_03990 [Candidatus Magasanikbacteria bacterium RIFCSPHIGHO2_02_FULL_50_9b]